MAVVSFNKAIVTCMFELTLILVFGMCVSQKCVQLFGILLCLAFSMLVIFECELFKHGTLL